MKPQRGRHPGARWFAAAVATSLCLAFGLGILPAVASDPAQLRLRDDFEGPDFSGTSGLYYKDNEEQRAGHFRMQGAIVREGKGALEATVVPRCRPDAGKCSERAEIWERREVLAPYSATLWYAFSMRLDETVLHRDHRYVVAQWKRAIKPGAKIDYSPFLAIRIIRGQLAITVESDAMATRARRETDPPHACAGYGAPAQQRVKVQQTRLLVAVADRDRHELSPIFDACAEGAQVIPRGGQFPQTAAGWIDFVFKVKPGPKGDGDIEILANGAWIASVRGRIGHEGPDLGPNQYFKFGPYRDGGLKESWRVVYDAFRRGPACEDVAEPSLCRRVTEG
jgi:hypothetical protein